MKKSEEMLFALLRASLQEKRTETSFFVDVTETDWNECFLLAKKQGVMALAWDGVLALPNHLRPPLTLKLQWGVKVDRYEKQYIRYCRTIDKLSRLYARNGIATMQLKGVGFSSLYPIPCHREGGDIDIYTYAADKERMSDAEANELANCLMEQQGIEVDTHSPKHSVFYYKGVPIENHKTFLNVETYQVAVKVERTLKENMKPQITTLDVGEVLTPSPLFNTLFIAFHAMQHYGSGLALHHLCDWAMILRRYGLQVPEEIKKEPFYEGIAAMTKLCNRYLGTSVHVEGGDDIVDTMLHEILYPCSLVHIPTRNKIGIVIYKIKRLLYVHKLKSRVLPSSLFNRIWKSVVFHICNPRTIF